LILTDITTTIEGHEEKLLKFCNLALLFVILYLSACNNSGASALVGKWVSEEEQNIAFEFVSDGTGTLFLGENGVKFTWTAEEKGQLILMIYDRPALPINFEISGSALILDGDKYNKLEQ
jgi:hypothetical protein